MSPPFTFLEPREGDAGAGGLLTAGDGRQGRLSLTALRNITHIAREIPGVTEPRWKGDKAQGGMICFNEIESDVNMCEIFLHGCGLV